MKSFDAHKGLRNDVSTERFKDGDLYVGDNIELDKTGKAYRRLGHNRVIDAAFHSAWHRGSTAYIVEDDTLSVLNNDLTRTPLTTVVGRVNYVLGYNAVYCVDAVRALKLNGTAFMQLGITPPPVPVVANIAGTFREGTYLVAATYVRDDGEESGASTVTQFVSSGLNGVNVTIAASTDPTVTLKRLYMTTQNGELLYLIGEFPNNDNNINLLLFPSTFTVPLRTQTFGQAPGGHLIGMYNGRVYIAQDNVLWYSQPYEHGLFHRMNNFLGFEAPVRTFAAVSDGIFVGTDDQTLFLNGDDPTTFGVVEVADYGTVGGTETFVPNHLVLENEAQGLVPFWMSKKGLCFGTDGGQFKNLTGERFNLPEGLLYGASLLKFRGNMPQVISTLI